MKKNRIKILFKVVILLYFIIGVFGLLEDFSSRLSDWIVLGVCIFIIRILICNISNRTDILKKITNICILCCIYFALSSIILNHYGDSRKSLEKTIINTLSFENTFNIPVNIDCVIPLNEKNLNYTGCMKDYNNNEISVIMNFKKYDEKFILPNRTIVTYRVFYIVPMVNIVYGYYGDNN
ncbi:hypothetical protein [Tepidibacter hydrothermalis]|uniref:Uncharacterized protein n=1 Tax=Tepidibacter hydrothermalis TaxID=3036126 RepID=A0ABY8ECZ1_9FIRM|nr:hypothetical protein [Tepidibacter hydrothermalis]WFD10803.1 hypothetical protein P4S50_01620 [Tepidibacter hydrothermalis]